MDDYQKRFPTNVSDIGRILYDLARKLLSSLKECMGSALTADLDKPLPAILHYASPAPALTKWNMTEIIAKALRLPIDHIIRDSAKPQLKPGETERPENTQLSTKSLIEIGVDVSEEKPFDAWWTVYIAESK